MSTLPAFFGRRIVLLLLTLWAVSILIFAITRLLPGDVATMILGMSATEQDLATLRHQMGLEQPAVTQYLNWLGGLLQGDLGMSLRFQRPIAEVLRQPLENSAILGIAGTLFAMPLGIGLGVLSALWRGSLFDRVVSGISLFAAAMPEFVTGGILIVVFSSWLGWLPAFAGASDDPSLGQRAAELIMPILALSFVIIAYILRMTRASVVETLDSDFVRAAVLKGISWPRIIFHHVLPVSLGPTLQVIALSVGWIASGLVVVESLFGISGVGRLLVFAIQNRDIPLLQTICLIVAGVYAVANMAADLGQRVLDPRVAT
jgi:peptide/nickel transport system permease protein